MRLKQITSLLIMIFLPLISSCSSSKASLRDSKGTYLENAKLNFEAGLIALGKEEYEKALGYFQFVKSKYPFSQFSALSDLKIADTKYAQKKWLDAASAYEIFVRLHPRHEQVPYASYRIGASYFFAIPNDFFLLPAKTSRDQSSTKEALAAMDRYILSFPGSEYISDAKDKQVILFSNLAKHNIHIANYYIKRGQNKAAVERLLSINELYPTAQENSAALLQAGIILADKLADTDQAIEVFSLILERETEGPIHDQAALRLETLLANKIE